MPEPITPEKYFTRLAGLIAAEEAEEIMRRQQEFVSKTPEERERAGQALLGLELCETHYSAGGHRLLSFRYSGSRPLPVYSPEPGDMVSLSENPYDFSDAPAGTVYEKEDDTITVAFNSELGPRFENREAVYSLNIAANRATYQKMREALSRLQNAQHDRKAFFRDLVMGTRKPESYDPLPLEQIKFFNQRLNKWQKEAVRTALAVRDIALLHGPPGTGKTTVLVEIIRQYVSQDKFVFAAAPSNTACDHLLEQLVAAGIPALRLGHPARIMRHLRPHTLDYRLAAHPAAKEANEMEALLQRLIKQRDRRSSRGSGMDRDERRAVADEMRDLKNRIRDLDDAVFYEVFHQAPVMVGTLTAAGDRFFEKRPIDILVMDEATQAQEPSAWISMQRAQKIILAGDPFQLPPTVRSRAAAEGGLGVTVFEKLDRNLGAEWKAMLRMQYRMHEKIMNFSSREFYQNLLVADESVRAHVLADLPGIQRNAETEEAFIYLDTAGRGFEEEFEPGSGSRFNKEEARLVADQLKKLIEAGVKPADIAVISPYSAQVRLLTRLLNHPGLEVDSVDGFQGREKEAVILSLVRSNVEGEMGFLTDTRRMNVAMTRARRKLVVVGDSATLANIPFYRDFIQYAESIGAYHSVWESLE